MELKGKTIIVTGAGNGIGRAIAANLARQGVNIAMIDIRPEAMEETSAMLNGNGSSAKGYVCNVSNEEQVISAFDEIIADHGTIHGIVNNAGVVRDGLLVKVKDGKVVDRLSMDKWHAVVDVNLTGVFLCGREAATRMIDTGSKGVIVNISSISRSGNFGQSNYTATKAGVAAMTVTWAKELARHGLRCAAVAPGYVATEMVMSMKPEVRERMTGPTPLQRLGKPDEIAHTVMFILENDFITGRMIDIDGGLRI